MPVVEAPVLPVVDVPAVPVIDVPPGVEVPVFTPVVADEPVERGASVDVVVPVLVPVVPPVVPVWAPPCVPVWVVVRPRVPVLGREVVVEGVVVCPVTVVSAEPVVWPTVPPTVPVALPAVDPPTWADTAAAGSSKAAAIGRMRMNFLLIIHAVTTA